MEWITEIIHVEEKENSAMQVEKEKLESVKKADAAVKTMHDFTSPEELYQELMGGIRKYHPSTDLTMVEKAYNVAKEKGFTTHVGNILSSDIFYNDQPEVWKKWADMGCLAFEMESYALYSTAAHLKKQALCILTVSDSLVSHEETTAEQLQTGFNQMMEVALELA